MSHILDSLPNIATKETVDLDAFSQIASNYWDNPQVVIEELRKNGRLAHTNTNQDLNTIAVYYFTFGVGGTELVITHSIKIWLSMGYRVVVLMDEGESTEVLPKDLEVYYLPHHLSSSKDNYEKRAYALEAALKKSKASKFVYSLWTQDVMPWDCLLARLLGIQTIGWAHGNFAILTTYPKPNTILLPKAYSVLDSMLTLSDVDAAFWSTFQKNVQVYCNPIDRIYTDVFNPNAGKIQNRLLWVGRFSYEKFPLEALDSLSIIARKFPRIQLTIAGPISDQNLYALFNNRAKELNLTDNIEFVGSLTASKLKELYSTSQALLFTSHSEGYALTLAEAKSCGLPIVMYDLRYLTLCKPDTGVLTSPIGNTSKLAQQVIEILANQGTRDELSKQALAHAKQLNQFDYVGFWKKQFTYNDEQFGEKTAYSYSCSLSPTDKYLLHREQMIALLLSTLKKNADERIRLNSRINELECTIKQLSQDMNCLVHSVSFKTGRALTAFPRKLRDTISRLK